MLGSNQLCTFFYHLHCLKIHSFFQKMGQNWCIVFVPCGCLMTVFAAGCYQERRVLGKTYIFFLYFVLAQKSVFLVQTLPALRFGTLNVGVVNGVSEVMAGQHLNSWKSWGEDNAYVINCRWNLLFSFPSPTLLPLIKTPLEGVWRVGTPLGYSGSQNPQGQAVAEGCFLPQPCNPELLSVTGEAPKGHLAHT